MNDREIDVAANMLWNAAEGARFDHSCASGAAFVIGVPCAKRHRAESVAACWLIGRIIAIAA